jgi:hypothetical protein
MDLTLDLVNFCPVLSHYRLLDTLMRLFRSKPLQKDAFFRRNFQIYSSYLKEPQNLFFPLLKHG